MEEFLPSYMTQAKMKTPKEDGGVEVMKKGGGCLVMMFRMVRW